MGKGTPHRIQRNLQITPLTDANTVEIRGKEYVTAAFARELERNLQDALGTPDAAQSVPSKEKP